METDVDKWPSERISKLDAARRQLRTAIRLFFEERDSISIHALTAASHELLRTLIKARGGMSFLKDSDLIRPEFQREYGMLLNRPQNFFKHADRDPDEVLDFKPDETMFWLFDCIRMDSQLNSDRFSMRECRVFSIWFMYEYPEYLKRGAADRIPQQFRQAVKEFGSTKRVFQTMIERPDRFPMPDLDRPVQRKAGGVTDGTTRTKR